MWAIYSADILNLIINYFLIIVDFKKFQEGNKSKLALARLDDFYKQIVGDNNWGEVKKAAKGK